MLHYLKARGRRVPGTYLKTKQTEPIGRKSFGSMGGEHLKLLPFKKFSSIKFKKFNFSNFCLFLAQNTEKCLKKG